MNQPSSTPSGTEPGTTPSTVKTEAEKVTAAVREEAGETGAKIKEEAKAAAGHLQNAGLRYAASQKDALSKMTGDYAEAAAAAATRLREGGQANLLAEPAGAAADQLGRLSRYLKESDPKEIVHGMETLARRRPELFFGGMFLAGLIGARFLKASANRSPHSRSTLPHHTGSTISGLTPT